MAYGDKLDGGGNEPDARSAGAPSTGTPSTGTPSTGTPSTGTPTPSAGNQSTSTQQTGNYWPAGEDYWPAAEGGSRRLGEAGSGEPDEASYDYEDGQS
jgi:hypothetical protein